MGDASTKEAMTNTKPGSHVQVDCDCNTMWSLAQDFSSRRLAQATGDHKGRLIEDYAVRARRIAGTYARFYLELEDGGNPEKLGRYYWMALGAFASKTVACTFDAWQVATMSIVTKTVWKGLGKGNLWLFCDISGWHWYYNNHPASFDLCINKRDSKSYVGSVKTQLKRLPWSDEALPKINYFKPSKEIKDGFSKVKEFENQTNAKARAKIQYEHLLVIANHEQGVILQPLIYSDADFATWVQRQRAWYAHWASPALELVFSHRCSTKRPELTSVAPDETKLENFSSRMNWISKAADKFHGLMQKQPDFMQAALHVMAAWSDIPDHTSTADSS